MYVRRCDVITNDVICSGIGPVPVISMVSGSTITWDPNHPPSIEHISLSFGLSIATLAMSIQHISGGLINPAVSVAQIVTRKISIVRGMGYIAIQAAG
ncbi:hypothetical protein QZH41_006619, partial [Actinostola sp. cb2023]